MSPLPAYRYAMPSAVVVGAGVFGSSLARQLAIDGWDVTVVEQEAPGWDGSSSGGESRLIRWSHGGEAWYVRSARRARELWLEIDPSVLSQRGLAGIAVERLEPAAAEKLFPSLGGADLAWVLFEPDAGLLWASRAVGVLAEQAREAGVEFVRARAEPAGGRVHLTREDDSGVCFAADILEADRIIWACGPWLAKLFPGLADLRPTLQ